MLGTSVFRRFLIADTFRPDQIFTRYKRTKGFRI